jgi:hypothetical protein
MPLRQQRSRQRRPLSSLALALLLSLAPRAHAQSTPDRVAAESLFAEGRQLLASGDYERACAKLEASRRLEPALGTSLNLADCYERLGRTASAWAEFKSAAGEAQKAGDPLRKSEALERARALEPRLSRLRIELDEPNAHVLWNGLQLSPAVIGNAIPVDPGTHRFSATAPGKLAWSQSVAVPAGTRLVELRVPALAEAPLPSVSPAPLPAPPPMTTGSGRNHSLAWTLTGAGAVGLGAGAILGALAASSWSKAEDSCVDYPYQCSPEGLDHAGDANTRATLATVALLLGGSALATGVVLFVTDSEDPESPELALTPAGLHFRGTY